MPEKSKAQRAGPIELVVGSTGLKIFGEGEWLQNKHKTKAKRKSWRKLHFGLDITTGDIVCSDLTKDDVGDPTALPELLDKIDAPVSRFLADGAYDGDSTSEDTALSVLLVRGGRPRLHPSFCPQWRLACPNPKGRPQ
jgi:hypothetical protein